MPADGGVRQNFKVTWYYAGRHGNCEEAEMQLKLTMEVFRPPSQQTTPPYPCAFPSPNIRKPEVGTGKVVEIVTHSAPAVTLPSATF